MATKNLKLLFVTDCARITTKKVTNIIFNFAKEALFYGTIYNRRTP
jgi:hypothetical protein